MSNNQAAKEKSRKDRLPKRTQTRRSTQQRRHQLNKLEELSIVQEARDDFGLFYLLINGDRFEMHPFTMELVKLIHKFERENYFGMILAAAPRSGKTEAISIAYAAWTLGRKPTENIALVSYSEMRSVDNSKMVRDIVRSKMFQEIFPGVVLDKEHSSKNNFRVTKGGEVYALGRSSQVTGRTFHTIIIDDIIKSMEEVYSEATRNLIDASIDTLMTRVTNKTKLIIIGTRWFTGDPIDRFYKLAKEHPEEWLTAKFPAIALQDEYSPTTGELWRKKGEALMPAIADKEKLMKVKESMAPVVWEAVYMQNPPNEETFFQRSWIQYTKNDEIKKLVLRNFLTIDPAFSLSSSADNTGFCIAQVDSTGKMHIRAWGERLDPRSLVKKIIDLYEQYKFELIGIETFSFSEGLRPFLEEEALKRNIYLPIKKLSHSNRSKETRILATLPTLYATGKVSHIEGECDMLEQEMFTFPSGDKDDVLDATAYMAIMLADKVTTRQGKPKINIPINWSKRR